MAIYPFVSYHPPVRTYPRAMIVALGLFALSELHASAQVTIDPASPRWGESITVTAKPNPADTENQQFTRSEFEVVPDSDAIARAFGVRAFPTYMIVDRVGKNVWLSGNDDDRVEQLRAAIYRLLASQIEGD